MSGSRTSEYPPALTDPALIRHFYDCCNRWFANEEALNRSIGATAPEVNHKRQFIELSKVSFSNSDFSEAAVSKLLSGDLHWRKSLKLLLPLIDCYEHITEERPGQCPVIPLTSRGHFMLDSYGNRDSAWRVIRNALKVGLISCVDDSYWFNPTGEGGECRLYAWNKTAQKELKEVARKNGIFSEPKRLGIRFLRARMLELKDLAGVPLTDREKELQDKVRVDTGLRIPADYTDEEIARAILRKYPLIAETVRLVDEETNPLIEREEQKIMCRLKITRNPMSGVVTKIGWRPTTHYVSLKKDRTMVEVNSGVKTKREYLDDLYGKGNWKEWDVKSSVPRLAFALNHGLEWLPTATDDVYEDMAPAAIKQSPEQWNHYRGCSKKLFLRTNFNRSYKVSYQRMHRCGMLDEFIRTTSTETGKSAVRAIKESLDSVLGDSCGSEIFILESYVYLKAYTEGIRDAKNKGLPIGLLFYDGFVTHTSQDFDFEKAIREELDNLRRMGGVSLFNKIHHKKNQGSVGHPQETPTTFISHNMSGYGKMVEFEGVRVPDVWTKLTPQDPVLLVISGPNTGQ